MSTSTLPCLLTIIGQLRRTTLRHLCEEIAAQTGCSIYRCYTPTREALDALVRSGEVLYWSTAKPLYVRAQDAAAVREELKGHLLQEICRRGQATPGKLKSVPLGGMVIAMDLMQELAEELIREGKIQNVGRKGPGRTKIYVPVEGEEIRQEMDLAVTGQVLRYLKGLHDRNLFRDSAVNITKKLGLVRDEVDNALKHLEERGLLEITQVGFLKFYAFAARTMVIRQVDPSTLSYGQVAYAHAEAPAQTQPETAPADDVQPAAPRLPALPVLSAALRAAPRHVPVRAESVPLVARTTSSLPQPTRVQPLPGAAVRPWGDRIPSEFIHHNHQGPPTQDSFHEQEATPAHPNLRFRMTPPAPGPLSQETRTSPWLSSAFRCSGPQPQKPDCRTALPPPTSAWAGAGRGARNGPGPPAPGRHPTPAQAKALLCTCRGVGESDATLTPSRWAA